MNQMNQPASSESLDPERYRRILAMCAHLEDELSQLEKEGYLLRHDIQAMLDKHKIKTTLERIIDHPSN